MAQEVRAGTLAELQAAGQLRTKVGSLPVVVFWHDGAGLRDRGPLPAPRLPAPSGHRRVRARHLPLAPRPLRPRVGLHARPLGRRRARLRRRDRAATTCSSAPAPTPTRSGTSRRRLREGLEEDITLVVAKSVLGLLDAGVEPGEIVRTGVEFGARTATPVGAPDSPCSSRWRTSSPTSTATTARSRSCTVSRSSRATRGNHAPRFPVGPLTDATACRSTGSRRGTGASSTRARRDAAERALETALADAGAPRRRRGDDVRGRDRPRLHRRRSHDRLHEQGVRGARPSRRRRGAARCCPTLVRQTAPRATLRGVLASGGTRTTSSRSPARRSRRSPDALRRRRGDARHVRDEASAALALAASSTTIRTRSSDALLDARARAASTTSSSAARSRTPPRCASPASTSRTTTATGTPSTTRSPRANALHQALRAQPDARAAARLRARRAARLPRPLPQRARGPAPPHATTGDLDALAQCFEVQGMVDDAGQRGVRLPARRRHRAPSSIAALGHALLVEDAEFHWFQTVEAGVRQAEQWPEGSEESALVLAARRAVPRRAHADAPRAADRRPHRDAAAARRSALRRRRRRPRRRRSRLEAAADVDGVGLVHEVGAALAVARRARRAGSSARTAAARTHSRGRRDRARA